MGNEILSLIERCQKGDKDLLILLLQKFDPLLNKYSRMLNYKDGEDEKQDLVLEFIKVVKKIPIYKDGFKEDKVAVSYISRAIKYKYIQLSKKSRCINNSEFSCEYDIGNCVDSTENKFVLSELINNLSDIEKSVIKLRYFAGLSDREIASINNIRRQAVNQNKNRALKKLRQYF